MGPPVGCEGRAKRARATTFRLGLFLASPQLGCWQWPTSRLVIGVQTSAYPVAWLAGWLAGCLAGWLAGWRGSFPVLRGTLTAQNDEPVESPGSGVGQGGGTTWGRPPSSGASWNGASPNFVPTNLLPASNVPAAGERSKPTDGWNGTSLRRAAKAGRTCSGVVRSGDVAGTFRWCRAQFHSH